VRRWRQIVMLAASLAIGAVSGCGTPADNAKAPRPSAPVASRDRQGPSPVQAARTQQKFLSALVGAAARGGGTVDLRTIAAFAWRRVLLVPGPESSAELVTLLAGVGAKWASRPPRLGYNEGRVVFLDARMVVASVRADGVGMIACVATSRGYARGAARFDVLASRLREHGSPLPILATRGTRDAEESRCLRSLGATYF
jgi:hypothetical protein